jgi:bidirectional [NiFe] hydrogenase diaphorase subunit
MGLQTLHQIASTERARQKPVRLHCWHLHRLSDSGGPGDHIDHLQGAIAPAHHLQDRVEVVGVGCMGFVGRGPLVEAAPQGVLYEEVRPPQAASIVEALVGGTARPLQGQTHHPFARQLPAVVREYSGKIDPGADRRIYRRRGLREPLHRALYDMTPAQVVERNLPQWSAGAWRRRLPDRLEVGDGGQDALGDQKVHCLQRR